MSKTAAPAFPAPVRLGDRKYWALSVLIAYEAALAGRPPPDPLPPEQERFLSTAKVKERYDVSDMWIWRRLAENERETEAV